MTARDPDEHFMRECLREAAAAEAAGEVPIGAVVVREGQIIGRGHNRPIGAHDPTAHAEIVALRAAGRAAGNYRLVEGELFVTVEPCVMCVGALMHARLRRVVFGCGDPKTGALGGMVNLIEHAGFNHRFAVRPGVCAEEARALLQGFFQARRGEP
jgi:tRNA(adenine34) deaminase